MTTHRYTATRVARALSALTGALFVMSLSLPASAGEDDAMISCTVRIEHDDQLAESFADGLTIEEAEDHALEGACALRCVTSDDGNEESGEGDNGAAPAIPADAENSASDDSPKKEQSATEAATTKTTIDTPAHDPLAVDDPDGVEACIERCAEDAILIGTLCLDAHSQTVFAEGAFDPDDVDGTSAAGQGYGGEDDGDDADAGTDEKRLGKSVDPAKKSEPAAGTTPPAAHP